MPNEESAHLNGSACLLFSLKLKGEGGAGGETFHRCCVLSLSKKYRLILFREDAALVGFKLACKWKCGYVFPTLARCHVSIM